MKNNNKFNFFKNSVLLSNHVLIRNYCPYKIEYKKNYTLDDTFKLLISFLNEFQNDYCDIFSMSINNNLNILPDSSTPFFEGVDSSINIPITNTLQDSYNLLHEFLHLTNYIKEKKETRDEFGEFISILSEILFERYLIKNNIDEALIESNNRLLCLNSTSVKLLYVDEIYRNLKLNKNTNNDKIYEIFMNKYRGANLIPENSFKIYTQANEEILEDVKFVMGCLLSYYLKYELDDLKLKEILVTLNSNINKYDIYEFYREMSLYLKNDYLSYDSLNKLYKSFDKECYENFNKVYKRYL